MKKFISVAIACALAAGALCLSACGEEKDPDSGKHEHTYVNGVCECGKYEAAFLTSLPMSQSLQAACDQQGTIVDFTYETRAYALEAVVGTGEEIVVEKTAQVYLPYGYDESKEYNILYLMHGGGETYTYWLTDMGATTKNVLDNMIKDGKCDPVIVVAPTYECSVEGYEDLTRSADWTAEYHNEFRNDLVPAVEAEYSTYAKGDVSEANLVATRDHRGFAGFSMGSITTIRVMMHCTDIASFYGSYSAGLYAETGKNAWSEIKTAITSDALKEYDVGYWFNQSGTADIALDPHEELKNEVLADTDGLFENGENYAWILIPGGSHAYNCWVMGLYNSLLVFYK